jgi:hypothetical protein
MYSLTGLRVGYLVCRTKLLNELLKIQDTMIICAPHPGQKAVLAALSEKDAWLDETKQAMLQKVQSIKTLFQPLQGKFEVKSAGAFFAYIQHATAKQAYDVARIIGQQCGIIVLPGEFFGTQQERFLRFAFGNIALDQLPLIVERLSTLDLP